MTMLHPPHYTEVGLMGKQHLEEFLFLSTLLCSLTKNPYSLQRTILAALGHGVIE